jgi:hypothetical protein
VTFIAGKMKKLVPDYFGTDKYLRRFILKYPRKDLGILDEEQFAFPLTFQKIPDILQLSL